MDDIPLERSTISFLESGRIESRNITAKNVEEALYLYKSFLVELSLANAFNSFLLYAYKSDYTEVADAMISGGTISVEYSKGMDAQEITIYGSGSQGLVFSFTNIMEQYSMPTLMLESNTIIGPISDIWVVMLME